ncbi:MAG: SPOR domain-containing protein [Alphaproteobacteria bacterium]|jgi:hypothetical protein|nr:SPOR domain-containing protein [Alphaproteobacteria bacterium]MBT4019531.1 SPOR domain-containing protein [Alphaproteobacteria bacterium]MBT4965663.1 SPOR domain-containing protein [Alphaproteobacteria bacterium]MBT5158908.1 SPOR domain-containing protein [Alphaproteobacteria bacterium]MBT5920451.1 SPOR domain-containing protein [Alphaproteobacteria bacterium]
MSLNLNVVNFRRIGVVSFAMATSLLVAGCLQSGKPDLSDDDMAKKASIIMNFDKSKEDLAKEALAREKVTEAKAADKKAHDEEEKEVAKEKKEEKKEDADFAAMQKELRENEAKAKAGAADRASNKGANQLPGVSVSFVDKQMMAINERIHALSERLEDVSERVHHMTQRMETLPELFAELDLKVVELKSEVHSISGKPMAPAAPKKAPKQLVKNSAGLPWGVQLAAYKTLNGAETGWSEILASTTVLELNDAKVRYVPTKPNKKGHVFTLIVINEYASRNDAKTACKSLKDKGVDCVAVKTKQ